MGIICGPHWGSFAVRDHLRFNLGIISGLGIICGAVQFSFCVFMDRDEVEVHKNLRNKNPFHSLFSGGDHLRSTPGIICGSGSFAVQFGDHFRSGDHLRSGIICGAESETQSDKKNFGVIKGIGKG